MLGVVHVALIQGPLWRWRREVFICIFSFLRELAGLLLSKFKCSMSAISTAAMHTMRVTIETVFGRCTPTSIIGKPMTIANGR